MARGRGGKNRLPVGAAADGDGMKSVRSVLDPATVAPREEDRQTKWFWTFGVEPQDAERSRIRLIKQHKGLSGL